MKIKATYDTTKYYKGNKKISKAHGVIFMIIGFIILAPLLKTFGGFAFYLFYTPPIQVDCNQPDVKSSFIEYDTQYNYSVESYEKIKNKFYNETFEEQQITFKKWEAALYGIAGAYADAYNFYFRNREYFDYCFNTSISGYLDAKEQYVKEQTSILSDEERRLGD